MGLHDRVTSNFGRNQRAMPATSAMGVVSSFVAVVAMLALAIFCFARGTVWGGVLFLVVWLMAVGNLYFRFAARRAQQP